MDTWATHQGLKQPKRAEGTARLCVGSGFGLHLVPQVLACREGRSEIMEQSRAEARRGGDRVSDMNVTTGI
jgi:hypothetical protein